MTNLPKIASFLDKYEYIIFDMDGVITSEQNYWDIASLTVYELLNSEKYYGTKKLSSKDLSDRVKDIRNEVFAGDRLIVLLKERGVNSNWDLAFVVFSYMLSEKFGSYEDVLKYLEQNTLPTFEMYAECTKLIADKLSLPIEKCERNSDIWLICRDVFQEWYLGSAGFFALYGKKPKANDKDSMERREVPVIDKEDIVAVLSALRSGGKKLLVATGRSDKELFLPFELWDIGKYFEKESLATYTCIYNAEQTLEAKGRHVQLTKPHPYIFLKALFPYLSDEDILEEKYDKNILDRTLIVGDAGSDILAAKKMGADFLAVLTGVSGKKAEKYFKELSAEYIYPSIKSMIE